MGAIRNLVRYNARKRSRQEKKAANVVLSRKLFKGLGLRNR